MKQVTLALKAASMVLAFSMMPIGGASAQSANHMSAGEMAGHCRIAAGSEFAVEPSAIMIGRPAVTDSGVTISGSAGENMREFTCNYDAAGKFVNITE